MLSCAAWGKTSIIFTYLTKSAVWGKVAKNSVGVVLGGKQLKQLGTASVGKVSWIKVTQKRCNWADTSLIPCHGIGVRKNPSCTIYKANIEVSAWFEKLMRKEEEKTWYRKHLVKNLIHFGPKSWRQKLSAWKMVQQFPGEKFVVLEEKRVGLTHFSYFQWEMCWPRYFGF